MVPAERRTIPVEFSHGTGYGNVLTRTEFIVCMQVHDKKIMHLQGTIVCDTSYMTHDTCKFILRHAMTIVILNNSRHFEAILYK